MNAAAPIQHSDAVLVLAREIYAARGQRTPAPVARRAALAVELSELILRQDESARADAARRSQPLNAALADRAA